MNLDPSTSLPYATADLPGIGGAIKRELEDFEVEEIPAYEPSGVGEFLYLWMEKRDMGAEYFVRQISRRLDIPAGEVGCAGLKDRRAVTRQWVSVPARCLERVANLDVEGMRVLKVDRHGNKLRAGHLHGNRFKILIRDSVPEAETRLAPLIDRLAREGFPNFFGPQRFGKDAETSRMGFALLQGEGASGSGSGLPTKRNPFLRKLALSAAQSALFNEYLRIRMARGLFRTVLQGDVMAKRPTGGMFVATDREREQARFDARETVHTGPIYGRKTFAAAEDAARLETEILEAAGLAATAFSRFGKLLQGTRRANVVYATDLEATVTPSGVQLRFVLPPGSYATVLLGEMMKISHSLSD